MLKQSKPYFPFQWTDLSSYRDSEANRVEVYLKEQENDIVNDLIFLFDFLFSDYFYDIIVFNKSWWNYCLDTWDFEKDEYNYDLSGKSIETQEYLRLLIKSNIPRNYSGCCSCNNWGDFLEVMLECLAKHIAPYSPLFCDEKNDYFFYFHHTGSIGLYYTTENDRVKSILEKSRENIW